MTVLAQDLLAFIYGSTDVNQYTSNRIHYAQLPQTSAYPHVWFRVTSDTIDLTMDGVGGLHEAYVDVEAAGTTPAAAQNVADGLMTRLHGYKGAMSNATAHAIFMSDKDDDYIPYSNQSDEGVYVVAFTAHVWYST